MVIICITHFTLLHFYSHTPICIEIGNAKMSQKVTFIYLKKNEILAKIVIFSMKHHRYNVN